MKLVCNDKEECDAHQTYLTAKIDGVTREFLLDSGCDMSILPRHYVYHHSITPTNKKVRAANGAEIIVLGTVEVDIEIYDNSYLVEALVSEHIDEALLGMDWLKKNDCFWGFRTGQIMIGDLIYPLQQRRAGGRYNCNRVRMQENVTLPRRSETVVNAKAVFNAFLSYTNGETAEFSTKPKQIIAGVYAAGVVIPHRCDDVPIRILNTTDKPVTLRRGKQVAELEEVKICQSQVSEEKTREEDEWKENLIEGVDAAISCQEKAELSCIIDEYADCFSVAEFDLGRTTLVRHQIETGFSAPIRQALRRQPIAYLSEIDRQLADMEKLGIIEPSASPWASNLVVVTKKDCSLRMCVDYCGLNNLTRKDSYP